ncbi:alpha/beta hydrolase [Gordonia sp. NPDC058843]|uniref:alpha/beta hydrolase n=1 Tax=Gordonia sp. NPDC058843 TaxID=3346648 RepID=UPI00368790AF
MLNRWRQRDDFAPDLRTIALIAPAQLVSPRTLPVARRISRIRNGRAPVTTATTPNGVEVRVFRPAHSSGRLPGLLWIHGGGYVLGSAAQDDHWARRMSERVGIEVVSVDYRLAPEHPYPAAIDDCFDALRWMVDQPDIDTTRLAIGGNSAGGGLAAALAFRARDAGVDLRLQLLTYPMLDDRTRAPDPHHRLWNASANVFGWTSYLGDADRQEAVPARRTDLAGLPSAWIGVGTLDLFAAEDRDFAERLRAAGVECRIDEVPGAFHGFDLVAPRTSIAQDFFARQCDAVRRALAHD